MFSTFWPANVLRATAACNFLTPNLQKVVRTRQFFNILPRDILQHRNVQNGSDNEVFCAFWLANVLRATAACHFSTSELQKWLRQWGVLCILTCKCASRHGGVPFLNIGTSKMSPTMRCFVHFDLQMCFAPQRACHFSPVCQNSYLRTRRFSEATFRTSGTTNHWKNTAIRDVPNIFHTCTFFLVTLHACVSPFCGLDISSLLDTSTLLFNSAYCRKLDFYTSFDYCS